MMSSIQMMTVGLPKKAFSKNFLQNYLQLLKKLNSQKNFKKRKTKIIKKKKIIKYNNCKMMLLDEILVQFSTCFCARRLVANGHVIKDKALGFMKSN